MLYLVSFFCGIVIAVLATRDYKADENVRDFQRELAVMRDDIAKIGQIQQEILYAVTHADDEDDDDEDDDDECTIIDVSI